MGRPTVSGARRPWVTRALIVMVGLPLLLLLLALSRTPATAQSPPPSSADVDAARRVYGKVRVAQVQPGAHRINATWSELAAVAGLGGRAAGFDRVAFSRDGERGHLEASIPLKFGFWVNGHAFVRPDGDKELAVSGRVGHLPVPGFIVHGLIEVSRKVLRMRGAEIPPVDQLVSQFDIDEEGLGAMVDMPRKSRFFRAMGGLRSGVVDETLVESRYCHLVEQQKQEPSRDMATQVRRAFSAGDGTAEDNRATFIALAMMAAATDAGSLPVGPEAIFKRCGTLKARLKLLGREDLVKHWTVSAALTSTFGPQASISLGEWKEVSDSGAGGSGFSLVDLAADRSGTFSALHGTEEDQARSVRSWLAGVSEADLLPVSALALAEGMTESEFNSRYTSTDSNEFAKTVQRIDATLAVLSRYRQGEQSGRTEPIAVP